MRFRLLWLVPLALILLGCQLASPRTEEPAPTEETATHAPPTVESLGPTTEPTAVPTQTALPPSPTPTPVPPTPTALPTEAPIPFIGSLPDPEGFTWAPVASGLSNPIGLTNAGDGSGRIFVLEQIGRIRVIRDGVLVPDPFLDIRDRVGFNASEQGLLGIAFHPDYSQNGYFYINYTDGSGDTVIARFQVSADPQRADPASEMRLLEIRQPFPNHNGGGLAFGPDGMLYVAMGDGGAAGDPAGSGQSLNTLLGKILRLDVSSGEPYTIPPDNPFAGGGGLPEIWAYGLRNPWRIAFDSLTGDLYIGDVGQNLWEEIDFQEAGAPGGLNYGWDYREGNHAFEGTPPEGLVLVDPVAEYQHGSGCSVTGGEVYRGAALEEWQGVYLYGDYCAGFVRGLLRGADGSWQSKLLFQSDQLISSFGVDEAGEIYLVAYEGEIFRLEPR